MIDKSINGKFINRNSKKSNIILLCILLSLFLINTLTFRGDHDWGGDFSQYIAQAKSLVDGTISQLIENSTFRYENSDSKVLAPLLYPWGFPILLAPIYFLFGFNIFVMKLFINIFFISALAICYLTFKNEISNIQRLLIIAIIAYNPYFFYFKENILSDIPFLFFSLFSLFLIQQFIIKKRCFLNEFTSYALIGIFVFVSYSVRANGIILLPTLLLVQIIVNKYSTEDNGRKPLRILKFSIPYIVFFIFVLITGIVLPGKNTYTDLLADITLRQVLGNVFYYAVELSTFFAVIPKSGKIIYLMTVPFVILGLLEKLKKDYLYIIFSIFLVGLYIIFPAVQGLRYLFPVIPFYLYFLFVGLDKMRLFLSNRKIECDIGLIIGLSVILLSLLTISTNIHKQYNARNDPISGPYEEDSVQLFSYISQHTDKGSIIVFFKPSVMTLYTNRKSLRTTNIDKIMDIGEKYVEYIVCTRNELAEAEAEDPDIERLGQRVKKIFENNTFTLYQLNLSFRNPQF